MHNGILICETSSLCIHVLVSAAVGASVDHTLVLLQGKDSDYINANHVVVSMNLNRPAMIHFNTSQYWPRTHAVKTQTLIYTTVFYVIYHCVPPLCFVTVFHYCVLSLCSTTVFHHCVLSLCSTHCVLSLCSTTVFLFGLGTDSGDML